MYTFLFFSVYSHQDNPAQLTKCPKVVVTSYTMLEHLQRSMIGREWATLIVDESHHLRCSKKRSDTKEVYDFCLDFERCSISYNYGCPHYPASLTEVKD